MPLNLYLSHHFNTYALERISGNKYCKLSRCLCWKTNFEQRRLSSLIINGYRRRDNSVDTSRKPFRLIWSGSGSSFNILKAKTAVKYRHVFLTTNVPSDLEVIILNYYSQDGKCQQCAVQQRHIKTGKLRNKDDLKNDWTDLQLLCEDGCWSESWRAGWNQWPRHKGCSASSPSATPEPTPIQYPACKSVLWIRSVILNSGWGSGMPINYWFDRILILPGHFWANAKNMLSNKYR